MIKGNAVGTGTGTVLYVKAVLSIRIILIPIRRNILLTYPYEIKGEKINFFKTLNKLLKA